VLPATSATVAFICAMAVATWAISCCWLWIPWADCSETVLTSSMAVPSWVTAAATSSMSPRRLSCILREALASAPSSS